MSDSRSSGEKEISESDGSVKTPPRAPKKKLKGAEWRKRKRMSLHSKAASYQSSDSEPEHKRSRKETFTKKSRKERKRINATKKFFRGRKICKDEDYPEKNKDSDYSPSSDSATESDEEEDDWSAEDKVGNESLEEEEEEGEEDQSYRLSGNEDEEDAFVDTRVPVESV